MNKKSFISYLAIICTAVFLSEERIDAQSYSALSSSAGIFQSPKGIGVSADLFSSTEHFDTFTLTMDLQCILSGKSSTPGIKLTYNYNKPIKEIKSGNGEPVIFYAGPGIACGYLRDTNSRIGLMCGISADAGCMVFYESRLSLCVEFSVELGFHLREDSRVGVSDFKFYEAGLTRAYLPQIKIQYYW